MTSSNQDQSRFRIYLFVFAAVIFLRAIFALNVGLIDDEALHWSWTRELMLSYYEHPGMIGWLNFISVSIFGENLFGVRLPSFICYVLTVIMSFKLAKELFDEKAGLFTAAMMLFTPFWGFGGHVASPEPPFMLAWVLASWVFWQGVRPDDKRWSLAKTWLLLGLLMGLGLNSKFIIALLAPGFGLYLLMTAERRKDLLTRWPWIGALIATILCLPVFLWNIEYDWPGFRYQFHERHTGESLSFARWLGWWGAQWGFMTPILYPLLIAALVVGFTRLKSASWRFVVALALPSIVVFYPQPLWADYKPHWSGAAYLILCFGAGALWSQGLKIRGRWWLRPVSRPLTGALVVLFAALNLIVYSPFFSPFWPKVYRALNPTGEWNIRWDLSNEFYGWEDLGRFANEKQNEIERRTGRKPFLAALRYETTAQTYWGSKQKTYMLTFTKSHYTFLHRFRGEWDRLAGQDALVITTEKYQANPAEWAQFDSCEPEDFKVYRDDELARVFTLWHCMNFQKVLI